MSLVLGFPDGFMVDHKTFHNEQNKINYYLHMNIVLIAAWISDATSINNAIHVKEGLL